MDSLTLKEHNTNKTQAMSHPMFVCEVVHGQQADPELAVSVDDTEAVLVFDPLPVEGLASVESLLNDGPPAPVAAVTHKTQLRRRSTQITSTIEVPE